MWLLLMTQKSESEHLLSTRHCAWNVCRAFNSQKIQQNGRYSFHLTKSWSDWTSIVKGDCLQCPLSALSNTGATCGWSSIWLQSPRVSPAHTGEHTISLTHKHRQPQPQHTHPTKPLSQTHWHKMMIYCGTSVRMSLPLLIQFKRSWKRGSRGENKKRIFTLNYHPVIKLCTKQTGNNILGDKECVSCEKTAFTLSKQLLVFLNWITKLLVIKNVP